MFAFEWVAENRIREAIERGELDNLPGAGQPIDLEGYFAQPPELRMAYTVLRNSGFLPPQLYLKKRIEERVEHLSQLLGRWREQNQWYLEKLKDRWGEFSGYFPTPREMLNVLGVRALPTHFHPASMLPGPKRTNHVSQRKLEQGLRSLQQLIFAYNAFIENARRTCVELLAEIGELVSQLQFERIKEQVLDRHPVRGPEPWTDWSVHRFLAEFDATFQPFELTDGHRNEASGAIQSEEALKRPRWRWAFFRAKWAQLPSPDEEEV